MEGLEKTSWARKLDAKSTSGRRVPGPRLQGTHADIHSYRHTEEQGLVDFYTCGHILPLLFREIFLIFKNFV